MGASHREQDGRRSLRRRLARAAGWATVAASLVVIAVAIWVVAVPFPKAALDHSDLVSTTLTDRDGRPLRDLLNARDGRGFWTPLAKISPHLQSATIHAEDRNFYDHHGVDGLAIVRSAARNVAAGRTTSGASTITQQTVKLTLLRGAARHLGTKLEEALWAFRLERLLDKDAILEQYLNRVPYGNQLFGAEAAAQMYFDKSAADLSLAEAALLAGVPQAPSRQNPYRDFDRAKRRQERILGLMHERGAIDTLAYKTAVAEPLALAPRRGRAHGDDARHFTAYVREQLADRPAPAAAAIGTTLDARIQRDVAAILARQRQRVSAHGEFQAAAVVVDTSTGEVLAWAGSRDWNDDDAAGKNDGVLALRQPGSALKPFVYGAYFDRGGRYGDQLRDVPSTFETATGPYRPQNFDRKFHGNVLARDALASSLNVPAVALADRVGPQAILSVLHRFGFASLARPADHYGPGIALGNGEVSLLELAGAYATLGRGGRHRAPSVLRTALHDEAGPAVLSEQTCFVLLDMLSDDAARVMGFGADGPLALPFRMASKTGTSNDFRDNWAVGVTPDYTVAVWVGRFDGRPMNHVSGSVGAAPLLREVAQQLYPRAAGPGDVAWFRPPAGLVRVRVNAPTASGRGVNASRRSARQRKEWSRDGTLPMQPQAQTVPVLLNPTAGATFSLAPTEAHQELVIEAGFDGDEPLSFFVDGQPLRPLDDRRALWRLVRGTHAIGVGRGSVEHVVSVVVR